MVFEEKTMKSDKIYEGKILNLRIDTVELPDKKYSKREIVEHPGGVGILAIDEEGSIVLVNQFRKALEDFSLEIPAGRLELNEEPRETAIRELREETGYEAEKISYLMEFYTTPGYCDEKIFLFLAEDLKYVGTDLDEGEFVEKSSLNINQLMKKINRGEILDSKTIIAAYVAKDFLNNKM